MENINISDIISESDMENIEISDQEFDNYIRYITPLIWEELDPITTSKTKRNTEDMLMNRFTEKQKEIYQQIHTSSMKHGIYETW